ncbi:MAG: DMT family transporter [Bacillota bacterium]
MPKVKLPSEWVLLFVAFIWGINAPIMKVGLMYIPPLSYSMARMVIAVVFSWLVFIRSHNYKPMAGKDFLLLLNISFFGYFLFQLCYAIGIKWTTAGNASLILSMLPVSVVVINRIFQIDKITLEMLLSIALTLSGVVIIVIGQGKSISYSQGHLIGGMILFIAQFCYGYFTVLSKKLLMKYSFYQVITYALSISTLFFIIFSFGEIRMVQWSVIPLQGWFSILFSGLFSIAIGNFLWVWGIGHIGSTRTSLYNNLSPVFAVIAGCIFLHESFGIMQIMGAIIIFFGISLTRRKNKQFNIPGTQKNPCEDS